MSSFYDRMAATASRLLGQFGYATVTFKRYANEVDGETGEVTADEDPTTCTASAVVLPASKGPDAFDNKLEDGSLAGKQVRYLKVAAAGMTFEPAPLDVVELDGGTWQVLGCTPINPAGTPLVYGVGVVRTGDVAVAPPVGDDGGTPA